MIRERPVRPVWKIAVNGGFAPSFLDAARLSYGS
jgi:hypothetical protein